MTPEELEANNLKVATIEDAEQLLAKLKSPTLRAFRRKIQPLGQDQIDAVGTFFYVKESSGPTLVQIDNGEDIPIDVGTGPNMTGHGGFRRLTIKNISASEILTVVVYIGVGNFIDNRFTLVPARDFAIPVYEANTEVAGVALVGGNIAATTTLAYSGVAVLPRKKRKCLIVSNNDPANVLYILDSADVPVAILQPKQSGQYTVSGIIKVANITASPIPATISEVWYTVT